MEVLVGIHSLWRWVVLLVMVVALVRGLIGWLGKGNWSGNDRTLLLLATTAVDIQVLLGLIVYVARQSWGASAFIAYIHPLIMLIALAVFHIFSSRAKRADGAIAKHRMVAIGTFVALFLITAAIPAYAWSRAWYA